MKSLMRFLFFAVLGVSFLQLDSLGQTTGDFQSFATGNWTNVNTWSRWNGSAWINPAPNSPTSADGVITILSGHTITDATGVTADQVVVNSGGIIAISGVTFTAAAGTGDDLTINSGGTVNVLNGSTLQIQNSVVPPPPKVALVRVHGTINNAGTISNASSSTLIFEAGSTYDHQHTTTPGTIPTASWNVTSTCKVTGYTTNSSAPSGLGQNFGNFTWDTGSLSAYIDLNGGLTTVNGDLIIQNVPSSYIYLTATNNYTLNVGGDLTISSSYMGLNSTATVTINVTGNALFSNNNDFNPTFNGNTTLDVNGNFEISGGTTNLTYGGSANIPINVAGNFTFSSSPSINNGGSGTYTLTFDGSGSQSYAASQAFTDFDYVINNGSSVNVANANFFSGSGAFTIQAGGTLGVGSTNGLVTGTASGNVRVTGTRTYTANANIVYNGGAAQNLGNEWGGSGALNAVAVNLEIDNNNGSGVTNNLVSAANIVGDLTLTSGSFNIGGSNSMDIKSNFIVTSGTIGGTSTSNLTFSGSGTMGTLTMTSGSQELNNLTVTRAGDLILGSNLTIIGALDLTGNLDFSSRVLVLNGTMTGTGGLKSNNSSNLTIGGTGAFGTVSYAGSGNQLNNLTLSRTSSGTFTWASAVTINTALNLNFGELTHSSGLTMGTGSTIYKGQGTIITSAPNATTSYNLEYTAGGNTSLETPSTASLINNVTLNSGGTVNLQNNVIVNGDFILTSGTFAAGSNDVTMAGSGTNITANGGSFSQTATNALIISGSVTMGGTSINGTQLGNLDITGTLTMPAANIKISGNFDNTGTFNAGSGSVTFNGTSSILGNTSTFHNIIVASTNSLTAPLAGTVNVSGSFTNLGTFNPNNGTLVLTSSSPETINIGSSSFHNLSVSGSGTFFVSTNVLDVNGNLTLSSGTLDVTNNNYDVEVAGNWINNGGTFNERVGTVLFDGTNSSISGSASTNFYDLNIANGTVRVNGTVTLENTLTLASSTTFDADGTGSGSFTLISNASADARIAAIPSGSTITGNLTFERYLPSYGSKRWRNIGSAVASASVSDLQNEIMISGNFTGNNNIALGLTDPLGPNSIQSLAGFDESVNSGVDNDWVNFPVTTNTETFAVGKGYSIYVRDVGAVTFDLRGTVNQGNLSLPVSGSGDLWNLVSNPYPSSIDWDNGSGWTRSNIQSDAISVWNGLQYLTWNGSTGSLGNGRIPMGMAFWVQASNSSISLNINENAKTATTGTVQRVLNPVSIELSLTGINYDYTDKTHLTFEDGATMEYDQFDLGKLPNAIFNLSTQSSDGKELSINSISNFICGEEIPISITNLWVDSYRMEWAGLEAIDSDVQLFIKDNVDGGLYDLRSAESFIINVTADADHYDTLGTELDPVYTYQIKDRFSLVVKEKEFSSNLEVTAGQICEEDFSASLTIANAEDGVLYDVMKEGVVIADGIGLGTDLEILLTEEQLDEGDNSFRIVASRGACNYIEFENPVIINIITEPSIAFDPISSTMSTSATGNLQWYRDGVPMEGKTGSMLEINDMFSGQNIYQVMVSNEGCERISEEYIITGVDDLLENVGIEVYPNPASKNININLEKSAISNVLLRILSSSGKVVYQRDNFTGNLEIDVSGFESGIYIVEITSNTNRYVTRVVKQ